MPHRANSSVIRLFICDEALYRLRDANRGSIKLSDHLTVRMREFLIEWKNMTADEFVEQALPHMDDALELAVDLDRDGTLVNDLIATLDSEESRREYCRSFHDSLQQVADYEWTHSPLSY